MADTVIRSGSHAAMDDLPLWVQKAETPDPDLVYLAGADRALLDAMFISEGAVGPASWVVNPRLAGNNFSVDISPGFGISQGIDVAGQGRYLMRSTATVNLATPTPPATGMRDHRVIARVYDKSVSGVNSDWTFEVLEGTVDGYVPPAEPNNAITLAHVHTFAGDAAVTWDNIEDWRQFARLPGAPYMRRETTLGAQQWVQFLDIPPSTRHIEVIWSARAVLSGFNDYDWISWMPANGAASDQYFQLGLQNSATGGLIGWNYPAFDAGYHAEIPARMGAVSSGNAAGRLVIPGWGLSPSVVDRVTWFAFSSNYYDGGSARTQLVAGTVLIGPPFDMLTLFCNRFGAQSSFTLLGWG